jgi:hypothetical protein
MPYFGGGLLHLVIAGFFAVHVVRTGREYYWLYLLFAIPYVGSAVYFFAVYLPTSRLHHDVRRAASATARVLDPGRELREAEKAFDLAPTAQNQMRLASALLEAGDYAKAAGHYESCLKGPFASDPVIRLGAARARMQNGQNAIALELLESIRKQTPDFRPEQTIVALAKAYAAEGRHDEAREQFLAAVGRFASVESRAEYAIWALGRGNSAAANEQQQEIERAMKYWNKYNREMHRPVMKRLEAAFAAARKS